MVKSSSGKTDMRSFVVMGVTRQGGCDTKFKRGRFIGRNPVGAARKAFNGFCRVKRIRGVCTLTVTVQETTAGSSKKSFTYKLHRQKLKTPKVMMEGTDKEYVIEYGVTAKSSNVVVKCKSSAKGKTRGRMAKRTSRKGQKLLNQKRRSSNKKKSKSQ